jgi:hypothetical protein
LDALRGLADGDFNGGTDAVLATSGGAGPDLPFDAADAAAAESCLGFAATSVAGRGRGSGGPITVRPDGCCGGSPNASASAGKAPEMPVRGAGVSVDGGMASAEASPLAGGAIAGGREVSGP